MDMLYSVGWFSVFSQLRLALSRLINFKFSFELFVSFLLNLLILFVAHSKQVESF